MTSAAQREILSSIKDLEKNVLARLSAVEARMSELDKQMNAFSSSSSSTTSDGKGKKKVKKTRDPNQPKKPSPPYFSFRLKHHKTVADEYNKKHPLKENANDKEKKEHNGKIEAIIKEMWEKHPTREEEEAKHDEAYKKYKDAMAEYKKTKEASADSGDEEEGAADTEEDADEAEEKPAAKKAAAKKPAAKKATKAAGKKPAAKKAAEKINVNSDSDDLGHLDNSGDSDDD